MRLNPAPAPRRRYPISTFGCILLLREGLRAAECWHAAVEGADPIDLCPGCHAGGAAGAFAGLDFERAVAGQACSKAARALRAAERDSAQVTSQQVARGPGARMAGRGGGGGSSETEVRKAKKPKPGAVAEAEAGPRLVLRSPKGPPRGVAAAAAGRRASKLKLQRITPAPPAPVVWRGTNHFQPASFPSAENR
jgi:hypothetical protein